MSKRPEFAKWLSSTNNITSVFLAAGKIPGLINVAGGLPDPSTYPVDELAEIAGRVMVKHPNEALNYPPVDGLTDLRDLIAAQYSNDTVTFSRENVLIVSGGQQGLDLVGKALLEIGDPVAAQSPAYLGAFDTWRPRVPHYHPFKPDSNAFNPHEVMSGVKFGYSIPNFSNPTGKLIDLNTRKQMVDAAIETGTWLIEDDPYSILYYDDEPLPSLLELYCEQKPGPYEGPIIYMGSMSKQLAPGLRIGWIIASVEMIETLALVKQGTDMCTNGVSQLIAAEAIRTDLIGRNKSNILSTYRERRDALCEAADEFLSPWFEWEFPTGGMFVWAVAKDVRINTDELFDVALEEKVCISPGRVFDPENKDTTAMRLNFTLNPPDKLREAARRIACATQIYLAKKA